MEIRRLHTNSGVDQHFRCLDAVGFHRDARHNGADARKHLAADLPCIVASTPRIALVLAGEDVVRAKEAGGVRTGPYEVIEPAAAGVPDELRLRDVSEGLPQALAIPVKEAFLGIGELPHAGAYEVLDLFVSVTLPVRGAEEGGERYLPAGRHVARGRHHAADGHAHGEVDHHLRGAGLGHGLDSAPWHV